MQNAIFVQLFSLLKYVPAMTEPKFSITWEVILHFVLFPIQ